MLLYFVIMEQTYLGTDKPAREYDNSWFPHDSA